METKCSNCGRELTKDDFFVKYCLDCHSLIANDLIKEWLEAEKKERIRATQKLQRKKGKAGRAEKEEFVEEKKEQPKKQPRPYGILPKLRIVSERIHRYVKSKRYVKNLTKKSHENNNKISYSGARVLGIILILAGMAMVIYYHTIFNVRAPSEGGSIAS